MRTQPRASSGTLQCYMPVWPHNSPLEVQYPWTLYHYHTVIYRADQTNQSTMQAFQQPPQHACFSEQSCLKIWKWSTMCKIHLYSPSGVVDISIKSIWMRSKTLCTLIGCKGARAVRACDFVCTQVLQCFRRNATSWRLMAKNCWFNAAKVLFMPEWIEFI